jgi:hypothetical protein
MLYSSWGPSDLGLHIGGLSYLASGIDDLSGVLLSFILDDFAKRILDRGIIALYKVPVHEPHRERGFSWGGCKL